MSSLLARLLGQALATIPETCDAVGIARKTVRNKISAGTWPVQTVLVGGRRMVVVSDLRRWLTELGALPPEPVDDPAPALAKRRPGRPRKTAAVARGGAQ